LNCQGALIAIRFGNASEENPSDFWTALCRHWKNF